jgi:hypothetical protein
MKTNQVHFILQGKGGVGKSLVAAMLAQYFRARNGSVKPFDTDPVNDTLSQYKGFATKRINILDEDTNTIDARVFDSLMEDLLSTDAVCVVDNGASTFVPLMAYLVENKAIDVLQQAGKEVFIHSVLTGGQAFDDTLQGLSLMLESQAAPVVVWLNEFFGPVSRDGKTFSDSALYKDYQARIRGVVRIEKGNADTFGKDMEMLGKNKMTFEEALDSPLFGIMPRQRLKMVREGIYGQLDQIGF